MKRIAIFAASVMLAAVFASCGKETGKYGINDKASDEVKVFDKKVEGEADLIDKAEALQSKVDDIFMKNNVYVELYVCRELCPASFVTNTLFWLRNPTKPKDPKRKYQPKLNNLQ